MSKFKEYKELNLPSIHRDILSLWKKNDVFKKSIKNRQNGKSFTFYEGPPSANGMPG
ncbi:MAG: class I tRNA ligase family protein, partial [Flavobacteriales bacterium]|nr:class I tRNA ligase family protein [Flavobacteriales bacterium]